MIRNNGYTCDRDTLLQCFAAELTSAVYRCALWHGMNGSWLDLELDLWSALADTVKKWVRELPPSRTSDEFKVWREGFLVDLTESAFYIAVKQGIRGSLLEVELDLYQAFRSVIRRVGKEALRRQRTRRIAQP